MIGTLLTFFAVGLVTLVVAGIDERPPAPCFDPQVWHQKNAQPQLVGVVDGLEHVPGVRFHRLLKGEINAAAAEVPHPTERCDHHPVCTQHLTRDERRPPPAGAGPHSSGYARLARRCGTTRKTEGARRASARQAPGGCTANTGESPSSTAKWAVDSRTSSSKQA